MMRRVDVRLSLNKRSIGPIAASTAAAMLTVALAIPAAAAPLERETFHDEFSFVDPGLLRNRIRRAF